MPDWHALVRTRLGTLPLDPVRAADIVDELAQHVAQHYADLIGSGLAPEPAVREALAPLDDPSRLAIEIARADRTRPPLAPAPPATDGPSLSADLYRDLRYALRLLLRAPAFTIVALLTLALGIGANTAIFSVLNAVLLRPLPYADPDRLVVLGERASDGAPGNTGYVTWLDWRERTHSFEQLALVRSYTPTLLLEQRPARIDAMRVSANFFHTLGVAPAIGRDFTAAEDTPAGWQVVILSDGLWRRRFDADPAVIGRLITLNGGAFTVIGVMPASFEPLISERYYQPAQMWSLIGYDRTARFACRSCQHLRAIGRVKSGVGLDAARADIGAVQTQLRRQFPEDYSSAPIAMTPLRDELTGGIRPALVMLMGAVAFVLLIACANVAGLLLARLARRERDLALRAVLGAKPWRLVRQLMIENGLLAAGGGALGVLLSAAAVPLLLHLAPPSSSRLASAGLDGRALAFSALASLATAALFGLLPAIKASRIDLQPSLHAEARRTAGAPTSLARRLLVAANVAMAVVLLVGAGLMIKSVGRLLGVDPGFDPAHVLTLQTTMLGAQFSDARSIVATSEAIVERLRGLPGVEAAAAAGQIPLGGNGDTWGFHVDGVPPGPDDPSVERYAVTPDYFSVMKIPLRRGRLFTAEDRADSTNVIILGEETARVVWHGADPIGRRVRIGGPDGDPRTVIGIVGDVRHRELAAPPTLQMYVPQAQFADAYLTFVLRAGSRDLGTLAGEVRPAIWSVASDIPIYRMAPMTELVEQSVGPRRFVMVLLELFGGIALLMTAIGVYGVISSAVAERTREIGIRAALGAQRRDIVRLVIGGGITVVAAGLAAGVSLALAASRFIASSLFDVSPTDPATFAGVATMLLAVALVAQALPIRRAMCVDPTIALRQD